jgi:hypothetical protein
LGRRTKKSQELEYELLRQIEDLKQEVIKLKKQLREKEKLLSATPLIKEKEKVVKKDKSCPKCGSNLKISELPMGHLELCQAACGYRNVLRKK